MFSTLKIQKVRGFEEVALRGLGRLNLLLATNGAGKTTASGCRSNPASRSGSCKEKAQGAGRAALPGG